ncbi:alpha/beta fold hydrolase [Corallococcus terminator]
MDESGPAAGAPSLLFVHGLAQGRGNWDEVLRGRLAERHHLVAIDLRGHGDSDKPEGDAPYVDGVHFAGDLAAVIQQLGLIRPVVVAWSYDGVVVGDYLRRHGDDALGGLFFVAAALKTGRPARALFGPGMMSLAARGGPYALPGGDSPVRGCAGVLRGSGAPTLELSQDSGLQERRMRGMG